MSEEDPRVRARVQEILAQRAMLGTEKSVVTSKPSGVEAAKPVAKVNVATETRTPAQVELTNFENKLMLQIASIGEMNKSVVNVEKELRALALYAKIFIGLGAIGFLTLLYYSLWAMHKI
jgi:hypothetical protein